MKITIRTDGKELKRLQKRLVKLLDVSNRHVMMKTLAKGVVQQTVQRIKKEKRGPDGKKWERWSPRYGATRKQGDSLLIDNSTHGAGDHLWESINFDSRKNDFTVFSDLVYANTHQFGDRSRNIPARPFFGISAANAKNIDEWIQKALEKTFFE